MRFQLTRPARGEPQHFIILLCAFKISTHSPRTGRTRSMTSSCSRICPFQLTRPARGEPLGEDHHLLLDGISTHSPRTGRTEILCDKVGALIEFQLTRLARGEPFVGTDEEKTVEISTHSPRTGRTTSPRGYSAVPVHFNSLAPRLNETEKALNDFNSLAPRGANLGCAASFSLTFIFQLTRLARGEPMWLIFGENAFNISTHSPRAGRTSYVHQSPYIAY